MYRVVVILAYWSEYIRCISGDYYTDTVDAFKKNNFTFISHISYDNYSVLVTTYPGRQLHVLQKTIKLCD